MFLFGTLHAWMAGEIGSPLLHYYIIHNYIITPQTVDSGDERTACKSCRVRLLLISLMSVHGRQNYIIQAYILFILYIYIYIILQGMIIKENTHSHCQRVNIVFQLNCTVYSCDQRSLINCEHWYNYNVSVSVVSAQQMALELFSSL